MLAVAALLMLIAAIAMVIVSHDLRRQVTQNRKDTLINRQIGTGNRQLLCDIRNLVTTSDGKQSGGVALCRIAPPLAEHP